MDVGEVADVARLETDLPFKVPEPSVFAAGRMRVGWKREGRKPPVVGFLCTTKEQGPCLVDTTKCWKGSYDHGGGCCFLVQEVRSGYERGLQMPGRRRVSHWEV
jgi:hypothetical protein